MAGEDRAVKLHIDNVYKEYKGEHGTTVALNGVTLDIMENEFVCVVGPSGCGKSTLLNIIAGLHEATSGTCYIDGKPIHDVGVERGVVFQQYALFPWQTVLKNVMFGPQMKRMPKDECEPGVRGNTATNVMKNAVVETGATIQVPMFVEEGEIIRIDTRTGEYMSRVGK